MKRRAVLAACLIALAASTATAQNKRDDAVKKDKKDLIANDNWIYNDLDKAISAAKAEKKPLLVVFR